MFVEISRTAKRHDEHDATGNEERSDPAAKEYRSGAHAHFQVVFNVLAGVYSI